MRIIIKMRLATSMPKKIYITQTLKSLANTMPKKIYITQNGLADSSD